MDGQFRELSPDRGGTIAGALLQSYSLILALAAFAVGAFLTLPGTGSKATDGAQLSHPRNVPGLSTAAFPQPADAHLIIIVDNDLPLSVAGFTRKLDSGLGWITSVEVVHASPAALQGLGEAIDLTAATYGTAGGPQIAVLDLRAAVGQPVP